mmetsp:Transcript_21526/g.31692  ORF Transcript_21526/g.31692 Transcript_21526/m.31692 type:complete len:482 (-) Transcript_21526:1614-3059(-)
MQSSSEKSGISISPSAVIATIATIYFIKKTWHGMPRWLKKHINASDADKENKTEGTDSSENGDFDLSNPSTIFEKAKLMLDLVDQKIDDVMPDHLPNTKILASLLGTVHLYEEMETSIPHHREKFYREVSEGDVSKQDLCGLVQKMEYADWAYDDHRADLKDKLEKMSFDLLRFDQSTEPGRVGHYIAINHVEKVVLIGLKGTSTISDVLTDIMGDGADYYLESPFDENYTSKQIRAHEGILTAALTMADETQKLIEKLFLPCKYRVLITGHSLGAGTACLLGLLLRSRISALRGDCKEYLEVFAFAPPPVLNYDAALACPFITSVVNNSDIVPRMSLPNLVTLHKLFLKVHHKQEEKGLLASPYALAKDLIKVDDEFIMPYEELSDFYKEIHKNEDVRGEDSLFVPGRVIVLCPIGEEREKGEDKSSKDAVDDFFGVIGNGSMEMLKRVEPYLSLFADHLGASYIAHLKAASKDCESTTV